jgi:hypothetical protein
MLTQAALNNAFALTETLDKSGFVLTAVPNSPLEALVKATRSSDTFASQGTNEAGVVDVKIDTDAILFMANKPDDVLQICQHDVAMDEIVEVASKAVQGHISFARTVVTAAIDKLVTSTTEALSQITAASILKMNVVQLIPAAPITNSAFEQFVTPFSEGVSDDSPLGLNLASITSEEIKELLNTGVSSIDESIAIWAATKGDMFLLNTWDNIFRAQSMGESNPTTRSGNFSAYLDNSSDGLDHALFVFLVAHRLFDNPLPDTQMALDVFNNTMVTYRNQAAIRVKRGIDAFINVNKNKVLVEKIVDSTIYVYDDIYREWIENGGDIEILFGNAISARPNYLVSFINENAEASKAAWNQHAALTMTVENNDRFRRTKEYLDLFFRKSMQDKLQANEPGYSTTECAQYIEMFTEQLEQLNEADVNNLYTAALKLVCRSEFYKTDSERILVGIEEAKTVSPNISVREAAAISIINYIAYWVSSQIKYDKVN